MTLQEVAQFVEGEIVFGAERAQECVEYGFASDLMSDVLTQKCSNFLLITGLANIQTIRTAEMSDAQYILFARNKKATPEMLKLAGDNDMVIIQSPFSMFRTAGILYAAGLKPVY
ncbi:MAG: hypothetical protein LBF90_01195 [Prevotellaceae bacterium]|jgi:predicted transcriptional regulator|nr:hypothetical protein [Prevotellaceae bacterium]